MEKVGRKPRRKNKTPFFLLHNMRKMIIGGINVNTLVLERKANPEKTPAINGKKLVSFVFALLRKKRLSSIRKKLEF